MGVVVVPVREDEGERQVCWIIISLLRRAVLTVSIVRTKASSSTSVGFGRSKILFASLYI